MCGRAQAEVAADRCRHAEARCASLEAELHASERESLAKDSRLEEAEQQVSTGWRVLPGLHPTSMWQLAPLLLTRSRLPSRLADPGNTPRSAAASVGVLPAAPGAGGD